MDLYEILNTQLKKNLYTVFSERFYSENAELWIDRAVVKHFLLKPELIIVNDQIHGFKNPEEKIKNLEKFSIYYELEYQQIEKTDPKRVLSLDLYAEANIPYMNKIPEITTLAKMYEDKISVEQAIPFNKDFTPSIVIYSKLNDMFSDGYLTEDFEEGLASKDEVEAMFSSYLIGFINFIKLVEEVVFHNRKVEDIKRVTQIPLKD